MSSGEGLIFAVRDPVVKQCAIHQGGQITGYKPGIADVGVADKRLLVAESEFGGTLGVMGRDGNNLSAVIRQAWDNGNLRSLTKNSPIQATEAHVSILGHVTQEELRRKLDGVEMMNGFANRFLWVCARRSKMLPLGGNVPEAAIKALGQQLASIAVFAKSVGRLTFTEAAAQAWTQVYPALSAGYPGLLGSVLMRSEAQVRRLACIYAVLDQEPQIGIVHLRAALAVWEYCEDSAAHIFGHALGDRTADRILEALRANQNGQTRTDLFTLFSRNIKSHEIDRALGVLQSQTLAYPEAQPTGGRDAEIWRATKNQTGGASFVTSSRGRYDKLLELGNGDIQKVDVVVTTQKQQMQEGVIQEPPPPESGGSTGRGDELTKDTNGGPPQEGGGGTTKETNEVDAGAVGKVVTKDTKEAPGIPDSSKSSRVAGNWEDLGSKTGAEGPEWLDEADA
jgi:hypothetical protein